MQSTTIDGHLDSVSACNVKLIQLGCGNLVSLYVAKVFMYTITPLMIRRNLDIRTTNFLPVKKTKDAPHGKNEENGLIHQSLPTLEQ